VILLHGADPWWVGLFFAADAENAVFYVIYADFTKKAVTFCGV